MDGLNQVSSAICRLDYGDQPKNGMIPWTTAHQRGWSGGTFIRVSAHTQNFATPEQLRPYLIMAGLEATTKPEIKDKKTSQDQRQEFGNHRGRLSCNFCRRKGHRTNKCWFKSNTNCSDTRKRHQNAEDCRGRRDNNRHQRDHPKDRRENCNCRNDRRRNRQEERHQPRNCNDRTKKNRDQMEPDVRWICCQPNHLSRNCPVAVKEARIKKGATTTTVDTNANNPS